MSDRDYRDQEDIFSKVVRAGRRTYFFDVRSTKADDYYLTITESKKFTNDDGSFHFKKHKIYLYKEDFAEMTKFIIKEKGGEVISERHQSDYKPAESTEAPTPQESSTEESTQNFTDVSFDDI